jgi:hypothetical protein
MIDEIINEIKNLKGDFKAEAILDQLLQKQMKTQQLFVRTGKSHIRSYSRDVFTAENMLLNNGEEKLQLQVTRTGLYDLLPEGLFFQPPQQAGAAKTAGEMAEEYRINKKQEMKVRTFFSPLEHDFFIYRYKSYKAETDLLDHFEHGLLNDYLLRFWKIGANVPKKMAIRMVLLLPFVHQITGSRELMGKSLAAVLHEEVNCSIIHNWHQQSLYTTNVLGQVMLGSNITCGNNFDEEDFIFEFEIVLRDKKKIKDYVEGGQAYEMFHLFCRYFVPANAGYHMKVRVDDHHEEWYLGAEANNHLGIASTL